MFAHHPYVTSGICSISNFFLNASLLPRWRAYLKELGLREGEEKVKILICHGSNDIVVPNLGGISELEGVACEELEGLGHESLYENTSVISPLFIKLFNDKV
jgi:hypothetical protein